MAGGHNACNQENDSEENSGKETCRQEDDYSQEENNEEVN